MLRRPKHSKIEVVTPEEEDDEVLTSRVQENKLPTDLDLGGITPLK